MQRMRMSLPYFQNFGWDAELVCVDEKYSEMVKDPLLIKSLPPAIKVHSVSAFSKKWTSKLGLGSLALRSLWYYRKYVNNLIGKKKYDLIYFSTTEFVICIMGAYWKYKFGIPYVIDMQDPWHSEYYKDKPKEQLPPKYWFSYRLNKYLEPIVMNQVDGLISVSEAYIKTLQKRYRNTNSIPTAVITFGAFNKDFKIAFKNKNLLEPAFKKTVGFTHLVYVGRGGYDMQEAIGLLFTAFKKGLTDHPSQFKKIRFHFIGTSYAPAGKGKQTIFPLALEFGISEYVEEQTDRISFYQSIRTLMEADALIVPGSNDPQYTASKIYPYILAKKPLLAIFNLMSSATKIIKESNAGTVVNLNDNQAINEIFSFLLTLNVRKYSNDTRWDDFRQYSAENMTHRQSELFDQVLAFNKAKLMYNNH
ncbi:MAG: hypothetical protein JWN56_1436 [Sphingobacteriales bacterium]|nr:hypothetical protein [Sphingobacteriales bacterium]